MLNPLRLLLPPKLRERIFYRLLNTRQHLVKAWFRQAPLTYAPGCHLHNLVVGDVISGSIACTGFYELNLSQTLQQRAREGGLLVDVGANLGYFSIIWLAGNPANQAIAIEASPRNQQAIRANAQANALLERLTLIEAAAGNESKRVSFSIGPAEQTGWGGITRTRHAPDSLDVNMIRLDEVIPPQPIAVLKSDVEGADTWVLQGAEKLLRDKHILHIFFEQHPERMAALGIPPGQAQALLEQHGYQCQQIDHYEWQAFLR